MRRAVIVGRAAGALDEYRAACALCDFDDVIVVGKMGEVFPDRIDHWVTFHTLLFDQWVRLRAAAGHPPASCFWGAIFKGVRLGESGTSVAPLQYAPCLGGSSGFLALKGVALDVLGVDRVVLAGVPMTAEGHHYEGNITDHERAKGIWDEADKYWTTWESNHDVLASRVRSMSGRTREAFGAPTADWLRD